MTYLGNEASHLAPVELYEFMRDDVVYRYTPNDVTLTDSDTNEYAPALIARREVQASEEDTAHSIEVELPVGSPVAAWFQGLVHVHPVWLRIRRRHRGQSGAANETLLFYGRVEGCVVQNDGRVTLTAVPIRKAVRRVLPTITVQRRCNWMLYDTDTCGVSEASHKWAVTITANAAGTLTVSASNWTSDPIPDVGQFVGGFVEWHPNGDTSADLRRQWVTTHAALRTLQTFIHEPTVPLNIAARVWLYSGCDRSLSTCRTRFNNVANFGGFPQMPDENPFDQRMSD
jgi:hypothetical protein